MKASRIRRLDWFAPLILFVGIIIDAALPAMFPNEFLVPDQIIVPHVTLFCLVTIAFYFRDNYLQVISVLLGLMKDSYTTTILGIYATIYFFVTTIVLKLKRYLPKNFLVHLMLFLVAITFVDFLTFLFYRQTGLRNIVLSEFIVTRLIPTYIFNIVLAFVLYFPTRTLLRWLGYEDYVIL